MMQHWLGLGPPHRSPTAWGRGLFVVMFMALCAPALADDSDNGDVRFEVYGRGWTATPTFWSDGHSSIIVVPDAASSPPQESDAVMAVNRYITQSGKECTIDGALHAIGPEITGTRAGWAGNLKCK